MLLRACRNLANDIIADARNFLQTRPWYNERGIPYRRGALVSLAINLALFPFCVDQICCSHEQCLLVHTGLVSNSCAQRAVIAIGYLLYGPPGTGKTSFVSVIAGVLKLNIAVLTLSSKT